MRPARSSPPRPLRRRDRACDAAQTYAASPNSTSIPCDIAGRRSRAPPRAGGNDGEESNSVVVSLCRFDAQHLGDGGKLGALVRDGGGELGRSAKIDDLPCGFQPLANDRVEHGGKVRRDAFTQIGGHAARSK